MLALVIHACSCEGKTQSSLSKMNYCSEDWLWLARCVCSTWGFETILLHISGLIAAMASKAVSTPLRTPFFLILNLTSRGERGLPIKADTGHWQDGICPPSEKWVQMDMLTYNPMSQMAATFLCFWQIWAVFWTSIFQGERYNILSPTGRRCDGRREKDTPRLQNCALLQLQPGK